MNIDAESITLLSLILRDVPQSLQFILCILARSNTVPSPIKFHSNTEYPTFYGYSNDRMPFFLMEKGVITNVPRLGFAKRLISSEHLAYAETVINKTTNWDLNKKLEFTSKFITLGNQTGYKDAEVFLVFRDKAQDYIKDYVNQNQGEISGFLKSKVGRFEFGSQLLKQYEVPEEEKSVDLKTRYEQLVREIRTPDTSQSRRGLEKKWDALQAIWTVYESNSRADAVLIPVDRLTIKGRFVEEIDGIIEGLKNGGCFAKWERKDRHYQLEHIDHTNLPKVFSETEIAYKEPISDHQNQPTPQISLECRGIKYVTNNCQLSYKNAEAKTISPETREIKFFLSLYNRKGDVVDYKDIARDVGIDSYKVLSDNGDVTHQKLNNMDFSEDVVMLRRDFRKLILSLGMPSGEFDELIRTVTKKGYQLTE